MHDWQKLMLTKYRTLSWRFSESLKASKTFPSSYSILMRVFALHSSLLSSQASCSIAKEWEHFGFSPKNIVRIPLLRYKSGFMCSRFHLKTENSGWITRFIFCKLVRYSTNVEQYKFSLWLRKIQMLKPLESKFWKKLCQFNKILIVKECN